MGDHLWSRSWRCGRSLARSRLLIVDGVECFQDFGSCFGWHGVCVDSVAVVFVQNKILGVAPTGGDQKTACLEGIELAFHLC
jgi:hypothetical protein